MKWWLQNSCRRFKFITLTQGQVIFLVACIFSGSFGYAATGSTWSPQSSWSGESGGSSGGGSTSRRVLRSQDTTPSEISPFSPGSNNLALDLGQVFLMGDIGSRYSDSLGTQLHYTYGVSDLLAFDSSLGYSEHSNGQYSMVTLLTGIRLNLSWYDKIIPYAVFGLGFYRPYYKNANGGTSTAPGSIGQGTSAADASTISAVLFGLHLGPGIDLALNRNLFFGAAVTFHNMFGSQQTMANGNALSIGGAFTSFYLHLGTSF